VEDPKTENKTTFVVPAKPNFFDEVILAKDSTFQVTVTRYTNLVDNDAHLYCALIEEIVQLRKIVKDLEEKLNQAKENT
jgi:hypothetical protein